MNKFSLYKKVCVITGGAGFLGRQYTDAIIKAGGIVIVIDKNINKSNINKDAICINGDITNKEFITYIKNVILFLYGHVDILINNACNNPKVEDGMNRFSTFEDFTELQWEEDLNVGLKGAFICSQIFGSAMANQNKGVILNISSDLGIIAPKQSLYDGDKKPVTYSVVKHGIIGLTKYVSTYWADKNVRCNVVCLGGVYNNQNSDFVNKVINEIPLGRMANADEYNETIIYLISDASSYMTGATIVIDGGRTIW